MKNYRRCRVWFTWNLLCGFPGEKNEDYEAMVEILPFISHLEAPKAFFNIAYHKSSIYERNRAEYGLQLEPLHTYQYVYSLTEASAIEFIKKCVVPNDLTSETIKKTLYSIYKPIMDKDPAYQFFTEFHFLYLCIQTKKRALQLIANNAIATLITLSLD